MTSVVYKYSPSQCTDYDAILIADEADKGSQPLDHCIGVDKNDEQLRHECNGHQNCTVFAQGKLHKMGHDGTNCDFNSNLVNIFYECIPSSCYLIFVSFSLPFYISCIHICVFLIQMLSAISSSRSTSASSTGRRQSSASTEASSTRPSIRTIMATSICAC